MSEPLIRLDDLACERDGRALFAALSLRLDPGQCVALRGPNGSGKSTLLRVVAGLYPDYAGTVSCAPALYLGHRIAVNGLLTTRENLDWYQALAPGGEAPAAALALVGLRGYEGQPAGSLSQGQQRRLALARLLVSAAPVWLLDEPYTALDDAGHALVDALIASQLQAGGAVLCATHQSLGGAAATEELWLKPV